MGLQVSCDRHSDELREVCVEIAAQCLPNIVVAPTFKALVVSQPDLGMGFVRDCLDAAGMPSLPDTAGLSLPSRSEPS